MSAAMLESKAQTRPAKTFRLDNNKMVSQTTVITTTKVSRDENENELVKKPSTVKYFGGLLEFETEIVWINVFGFLALHLAAVYGLLLSGLHLLYLRNIPLMIYSVGVALILGQGVTAGAHRLFSHKAYKAKFPLKFALLAAHTMAGQNSMFVWVRDHRLHHKFSDTNADPHNAKRGFFFSHCGWLMMRKHPEVIEKGKTIDMSDLSSDPMIVFQRRYYYPICFFLQAVLMLLPYFILGSSPWDIVFFHAVRYVIVLNCTWSVNSFAHIYGMRPYDKNILPVENRSVAILTFGEGWHNYHHVFPWDYKASELGVSDNFTRKCIEFWSKIGLAYDLRVASEELVSQRLSRTGDHSFRRKHCEPTD
ncbi:UNVERIFIED_CONTAM: hypothetical protein PYX00_001170 [Menopon gallinae]|uniref:Fatty acid desaturase domain-containing protein n=1 Tax=Menopon gallinae TaxID=328185 RepID=A0AAW2IBJ2_9NEOP